MEEEKKTVVEAPKAATASAPVEEKPATNRPTGNPIYEPHGSKSAGRPGDRKFGDHKGRPGERRGGRGGFRREEDEYQDRVVDINKVCRVEMGGKHMRFDRRVGKEWTALLISTRSAVSRWAASICVSTLLSSSAMAKVTTASA